MLTAAIGQNAMLWRTSPIATELEGVVVGWLRQAFGLPEAFDGLLTDTASTSSLIALAAAREAAGVDAAAEGIGGRAGIPRLRVYASAEAHSSIEKACMTLGLGRASYVAIPTDDEYRLRPDALAAAIAADRAAGHLPIAIVATAGTTSSTSVDPIAAIADIAERRGPLAARRRGLRRRRRDRAGAARACSRGWERADSIVVNPHKWLFTPLDASLLLSRRLDQRARARSASRPEYLRTLDRDVAGPRLQRVHAAARPPLPGPEAVDPAALVRPRGPASADPPPHRAGASVRGGRRRRAWRGSAWRRSRSRPSASATGRRHSPMTRPRSTATTPRSWTP